jgi:hypothetical protein
MIRASNSFVKQPSTFALLVDDISKMSPSEQKLLWMKLNKDKLTSLAKEMDTKTSPGNLSVEEVASVVKKARKNVKKKS